MEADEIVGRGLEGEAKEVVEECTGGGAEDFGEHDVHGVLSLNRSSKAWRSVAA